MGAAKAPLYGLTLVSAAEIIIIVCVEEAVDMASGATIKRGPGECTGGRAGSRVKRWAVERGDQDLG